MNGQAWTNAEQFEPMDATAEQSFGDLINFDHLDLDLSEFSYSNGEYSQGGPQPLAGLPNSIHDFSPQIGQHQHHNGTPSGQAPPTNMGGHSMSQPPNGFSFDYSMGQFSQASTPVFPQAQDHMYRPHQGVPPTPNSVEMHGDPHRYMQHIDSQQALFDQRYHMRKDDAVCWRLAAPVALRLTRSTVIHPTRFASSNPT
jgi:hypothetical protein